ncbi:hypothetical protein IFM89_003793 [Coptis chinensis]|uniref:Exostosin GT47 domain-containing protein n=1 Tax=Coptis chinensis TaxID=261450 RepID=A0A835IA48_9MAGN|nr:hypothetical protein IFM89_003793 [Coptis chinensis]
MEYLLRLQKLCQFETRRLLLVIGIVFAAVLVFQSSTLPYGNVLLSLFPSGRIPLLGRSSSSSSNLIPKSTFFNDTNYSNSSSVIWKIDNTEAIGTGKQKMNSVDRKDNFAPTEARSTDKAFEQHSSESVKSPDNGYTLENARQPEPSLSLEQLIIQSSSNLSSDNVQIEDSSLIVEKDGRINNSLSSALPPFSYPDASSNVSIVPVRPEMSSVGKRAIGSLPKDENFDVVKSGSVTSNTNYTDSGASAMSKGPESHTPIFKLDNLLLQSRLSVHSMRPLWSSKSDQELQSAKSQIHDAPILKHDQELYPSIFRNVSAFKRSYELMEHLLKVYIYREGEKPIFHEPTEPILKGIYASEGWFMGQMEKNKQFVVKDPTKAHLFYLPFSSRMLQLQLYVRNSHNRKNLAIYMKNYVDTIAAKYPFWNRTGGADHFLVACHDWAPFETRGQMDNCIKVLCNANIARDFIIGKDVTLPETSVRKVKDPLRGLGGNPPSERPILAFFAGGMHGSLRPILLSYWRNKDPDMKIFGPMPQGAGMNYVQHMKSSKYCICARGYDVNSPRVVEAIFYECVPVILADDYVPPFFEILDWEAFAVFVPEKDIPNLKERLLSIPEEKYIEMHMRVKMVQKHFLWHIEPVKYDIFHMILHSVWFNRLNRL